MKRSEFIEQVGGLKPGNKFRVVGGSQDGTILTITSDEARDPDGFEAYEITFNDGTKEVCAKNIWRNVLDHQYEYELEAC